MSEKRKSYVPVGKLKNNLRRLHTHCPQHAKVRERCKIDVAIYKCEGDNCINLIYDGESNKRYDTMVLKYPDNNVIKGKIQVDHINPVVDPIEGFISWDSYINRCWVSSDEMQGLCNDCHVRKSATEAVTRKQSGSLKRKDK
jgi:hypothetical protein